LTAEKSCYDENVLRPSEKTKHIPLPKAAFHRLLCCIYNNTGRALRLPQARRFGGLAVCFPGRWRRLKIISNPKIKQAGGRAVMLLLVF